MPVCGSDLQLNLLSHRQKHADARDETSPSRRFWFCNHQKGCVAQLKLSAQNPTELSKSVDST
jgi:hypothetical protein